MSTAATPTSLSREQLDAWRQEREIAFSMWLMAEPGRLLDEGALRASTVDLAKITSYSRWNDPKFNWVNYIYVDTSRAWETAKVYMEQFNHSTPNHILYRTIYNLYRERLAERLALAGEV